MPIQIQVRIQIQMKIKLKYQYKYKYKNRMHQVYKKGPIYLVLAASGEIVQERDLGS